ncbi:MAG: hypothetical protein CME36_19665 [unclassified Hahellaceae]|nr:hypothetical protein [Hahellaceae bacterium]|tara:strand:- start:4969 stop:5508 length:540 start_codon:yes stop_codon:yes gene_type:complete
MESSNFWPRSSQHIIHEVKLEVPEFLSSNSRLLIRETLVLTDILRANQRISHQWQEQINSLLVQRLKSAFLSLATHFTDRDSKLSLQWRARTFENPQEKRIFTEQIARMNERELVCYSGTMSTWVGKSRELFYSTFYAAPNDGLQRVSDVVDVHFEECIKELRKTINEDLIVCHSVATR